MALNMSNTRPRQPYLSRGWRGQLDDFEGTVVRDLHNFPNHCFYFIWPDMETTTQVDRDAGRIGHTCDAQWADTIYPYIFDGDWHGEGRSEKRPDQTAQELEQRMVGERQAYVRKNGPPVPGDSSFADRSFPDDVRVLSFWVSGGPFETEPRTIDPTGADPNSKIQLNLLIAVSMFAKREPWTDDYRGKNITRDDIGLPKPVKVVAGTPAEEVEKIEALLDKLATGLPEISVLGHRTWVDPPLIQEEDMDDLIAFLREGRVRSATSKAPLIDMMSQ